MTLNGFDRGLEAERIVTMVEQEGETLISVKFKGQTRHELIPADVVNREIPQMVIEFYVKHLSYELPDQEKEEEPKGGKKKEESAKRKSNPEKEPRQKKNKKEAKKT